MLPSTLPLTQKDRTIAPQGGQDGGDDIPPRVSNGIHKTVSKHNKAAANKYYKIRKTHKEVHKYWKGQE
jgi:hypothetical protein